MTDYSPKEIKEAVSGEKEQFSNLKRRIEKWDMILNEIHEDLRYLHDEFSLIYNEINKIGEQNGNS